MFPSIPKVPMLGGKLAAKKKVEFANGTAEIENRRTRSNGNGTSKHDYRIQQLMHGGPVQRALHADLLLLKSEFEKDLDEAHADSGVNANVNVSANNGGSQGSMREYSPGTIFKVFKSTFQRAKFAIVHTRCCPPRCDTEAYIQLIYSTVLELLRDVFYGYDFDGDGDGDREIYNYDFQLRATFVIFALYTLYETNPLDEIPIEDAQGQPRKPKMQLDDEKSTHNLLSALPMGLCAEQGGRKAHRRSYRSHIRIDQIDFSLIHKLRDLALLWMDNCAQKDLCSGGDSISSDGNEQESPSNSGLRSRIIFGLAIDCIHVIDRMNPSLQLCEYSGPASLEGLTGSTTYYHAVALKELVEPFSSYDTAEASQILRAACENVSNDTGEGGDDLVGKLEMISFETSMQACHSRYNDILGKVAAA